MCGVVDMEVCVMDRREGEERRTGGRVGSQKFFLKSWNSGQRHHGEGGRVRTEKSDWVETLKGNWKINQ
jgi:hypothetical protein